MQKTNQLEFIFLTTDENGCLRDSVLFDQLKTANGTFCLPDLESYFRQRDVLNEWLKIHATPTNKESTKKRLQELKDQAPKLEPLADMLNLPMPQEDLSSLLLQEMPNYSGFINTVEDQSLILENQIDKTATIAESNENNNSHNLRSRNRYSTVVLAPFIGIT